MIDLVSQLIVDKAMRVGVRFQPTDLHMIALHTNYSPWDYHFNEAAPITLAASATRSTVISFTIPTGMLGILDAFANGVENLAHWDLVTWQVRINRHAVPGFDNIRGPLGSILSPASVGWPLPPGALVDVVATNSGTTALANLTGYLRGRYFPASLLPGTNLTPDMLRGGG